MFIEERQIAIEKVLREEGRSPDQGAGAKCSQVTEDCIRKDLKTLENAGKLKRTYGGAILSQDYPLERDVIDRRNYHVDRKMVIATQGHDADQRAGSDFLDDIHNQY
ncbi:MAG: DeoR family transcriptional regulator [Ruminococcus sp.]